MKENKFSRKEVTAIECGRCRRKLWAVGIARSHGLS